MRIIRLMVALVQIQHFIAKQAEVVATEVAQTHLQMVEQVGQLTEMEEELAVPALAVQEMVLEILVAMAVGPMNLVEAERGLEQMEVLALETMVEMAEMERHQVSQARQLPVQVEVAGVLHIRAGQFLAVVQVVVAMETQAVVIRQMARQILVQVVVVRDGFRVLRLRVAMLALA